MLLDWREIERLAADGATIGSHSVTHATIGSLPEGQMRHELEASREAIRNRIGIDTKEFAIPVGRARDWSAAAGAAAKEAGYELVYAATHDRRPAGTAPRTFITGLDGDSLFRAALRGRFDRWEEWV
jgi:peptidoglycan/xylan/chitin deacetylase (PgdA/CDA1 family)